MKLNCGAERHHYSMFNVGRSMFDVQSVFCSCWAEFHTSAAAGLKPEIRNLL